MPTTNSNAVFWGLCYTVGNWQKCGRSSGCLRNHDAIWRRLPPGRSVADCRSERRSNKGRSSDDRASDRDTVPSKPPPAARSRALSRCRRQHQSPASRIFRRGRRDRQAWHLIRTKSDRGCPDVARLQIDGRQNRHRAPLALTPGCRPSLPSHFNILIIHLYSPKW